MEKGVIVKKLAGKVFLRQANKEKQIEKKVKLGVNVSCEIQTADASYAYITERSSPDSSNRGGAYLAVFPESRVLIITGRGYIKQIEILEGLALVSASENKKVLTPSVEFHGLAWVNVFPDGRTIVAHSRDTIYNRKTGQSVVLDINKQVTFTENTVGELEPMEQRFYEAEKTCAMLESAEVAEIYKIVAEKSEAMLEASLMALKFMADQTGQDFEKLKEEALQQHQKHKQWAQSIEKESRNQAETITKKDFSHNLNVIPVNQALNYQNIEFKIISVSREPKSDEIDLLSINIEAKNESNKQVFIFWNEEARLINERDEIYSIDDYSLETNFTQRTQTKGYLFIPVSKQDKKFILQFGKKSLPKVEIELDLTKTNAQGGD